MTTAFSLHEPDQQPIRSLDAQLHMRPGRSHLWRINHDMLQSLETGTFLTEQNQLASALDAAEVDVLYNPQDRRGIIRSRVSGGYLGPEGWRFTPYKWHLQQRRLS